MKLIPSAVRAALSVTLAAGLAAVAPAVAQTTMKMNIAVAQNSHYGVAIDTFAREVEKRTNGRYKVQTFYSGALGAERESVEGVQLGTLDLTLTSTGPLPTSFPRSRFSTFRSFSATTHMLALFSTGRSARSCSPSFRPRGWSGSPGARMASAT